MKDHRLASVAGHVSRWPLVRIATTAFVVVALVWPLGGPVHAGWRQASQDGDTDQTATVPGQDQAPVEQNGDSLNPFMRDKEAIGRGAMLFRQMCAACHGIRGQGGKGPNLTDNRWLHGSGSDKDIFRVVRHGVRGTTMKELSPVITDLRIWKIIAYVRTLAGSAADSEWQPGRTGDAIAGRKLFFDEQGKADCVQCHAVDGNGGRTGPSLSGVAARRSAKYLMESMTAPSAYIHSDYQSVDVVTSRGQVITGVQVNEDNFSIQLREHQTGRFHSFFKHDLEEIRKRKKSIMPENLTEQITAQQLHDVFYYLISLDGRQMKE